MNRLQGLTRRQLIAATAASTAGVHPSRDSLPEGQIFYAAGPSTDGWKIVGIHDSKESWKKFHDGILLPHMQAGIKGGFTVPPQETTFPIYNLQNFQS